MRAHYTILEEMRRHYTIIEKDGEQLMFIWQPWEEMRGFHVDNIFLYSQGGFRGSYRSLPWFLYNQLTPAVKYKNGEVILLD